MSEKNSQSPLLPFLKWAGGKRWFVNTHSHLLPSKYRRYFEPFVGGGAAFFFLEPKHAVLSDLNADLVDLYISIRDYPAAIEKRLSEYQTLHTKSFFYRERQKTHRSKRGKSAQMLYLNRTCFNGLYRVNLKGEFNVPIGTKNSVLLGSDDFRRTARTLRGDIKIICSDFESVINTSSEEDFIFIDPPYTVTHNYNNFVKYNDKIFSWDDQVRLAAAINRAVSRGCKVLMLNAMHPSVYELYNGLGEIRSVSRNSVISGKSEFRGKYEELVLVAGYEP